MKKTIEKQLSEIRKQIDTIDSTIFNLLKERAIIAKQVAHIKQQVPNTTFYRPEREAQILRDIMENNDSLLPDKAVAQIFRDIMTACLALQKPLTIGYLGPEGTFTQMAAEKHFGTAVKTQPFTSIEEVFKHVESSQVHYGVVPIENSAEGMVNVTLDAFLNSTVQICGEIELRVHHQFMAQKNANIKKIYSHQQSFAQCRQWLLNHYPNAEVVEVLSNGLAAKLASKDAMSGAISSYLSSELYDLEILAKNIEDYQTNTTRFVIIGNQTTPPSGHDKTSILISSPHTPGSLSQLLQPFDKNNINMTMIESRPYRHRNWSYLFFIDIEGHQEQTNVKAALNELAQMSVMMNLLGSYPKSIT